MNTTRSVAPWYGDPAEEAEHLRRRDAERIAELRAAAHRTIDALFDKAVSIATPPPAPNMPVVHTSEAIAEVLGVAPQTVRAMCRDGRLHGVKAGDKWVVTHAAFAEFLGKRHGKRHGPAPASEETTE